jgi:hypothetical protein
MTRARSLNAAASSLSICGPHTMIGRSAPATREATLRAASSSITRRDLVTFTQGLPSPLPSTIRKSLPRRGTSGSRNGKLR